MIKQELVGWIYPCVKSLSNLSNSYIALHIEEDKETLELCHCDCSLERQDDKICKPIKVKVTVEEVLNKSLGHSIRKII